MQEIIKAGTQKVQINSQTVILLYRDRHREIILNVSDYLEGPERTGGAVYPSLTKLRVQKECESFTSPKQKQEQQYVSYPKFKPVKRLGQSSPLSGFFSELWPVLNYARFPFQRELHLPPFSPNHHVRQWIFLDLEAIPGMPGQDCIGRPLALRP